MLNEYEFFSKDYIKFYFLDEAVNSRNVVFKLFLESDGIEKDFTQVRTPDRNVYRFNNFNVSEDSNNNCVTFRPNVVGCYVYFSISTKAPVRVEIVRNGTTAVAETFELGIGTSKLEFYPQGLNKYDLKISSDSTNAGAAEPNYVEPATPASAPSINSFEAGFTAPSPFDAAPVNSTPNRFTPGSPSTNRPSPYSNTPFNNTPFNNTPTYNTPTYNTPSHNTPSYDPASYDPNSFDTSSLERPAAPGVSRRERERNIDQLERSNDHLQGDISELESRIKDLERKNQELIDRKRNLTLHLERLQEEFDKDYSRFEDDVKEIHSKYDIDAEILKLYANKEVTPIEELLFRAEDDIKQIEDQMRIFIEAQERKTIEIENELKIGKKE